MPAATLREAMSMIGRYLLVMGLATAGMATLDRVPAWITGVTHGAKVYRTIGEAQAALGVRLLLPAYYPDVLAWPPERIEVMGTPPVIAIRISARSNGAEHLVVCQSAGAAPVPGKLLTPAEVISAADVTIDGEPARLSRLMTPGGRIVHDLSWTENGRRMTMRYAGPVGDLMRMAASMERTDR